MTFEDLKSILRGVRIEVVYEDKPTGEKEHTARIILSLPVKFKPDEDLPEEGSPLLELFQSDKVLLGERLTPEWGEVHPSDPWRRRREITVTAPSPKELERKIREVTDDIVNTLNEIVDENLSKIPPKENHNPPPF